MAASHSQTLLVEASELITATRLRIACSMTLLAEVAIDGMRAARDEPSPTGLVLRGSSHPPSTPLP